MLKTKSVGDRVSMCDYIALTQRRATEDQLKKEQKKKEFDAYMDEQVNFLD